MIGGEIAADVKGALDTPGGTYTGTANALIERPDQVFKYLLIAQLGFTSGDIGASFAASGASYASEGYKLAFIVHDVATDMSKLFPALAYQCRSIFHEWAAVFELKYLPDSTPAADFALGPNDVIGFPKFSFS